jgi:predicted enzyme related to lactoylglutathione lyase
MLASAGISITLPVVDLERAKKFYRETLGLKPVAPPSEEMASEMAWFQGREGLPIALYHRDTPTKADHTAVAFQVEDLDREMEGLRERGAVFEQYDQPGLKTDERGIATLGSWRGAWLKDSEGNILGVGEMK